MKIPFTDKQDPERKSIFQHVLTHINPDGPGLLPGGERLPDHDYYQDFPGIDWMPGAVDVIYSHPGSLGTQEVQQRIDAITGAFLSLGKGSISKSIEELEEILKTPRTLSVIDRVLQRLIISSDVNQQLIYLVCRKLFFESGFRGVVKFCIGVMGLYGVPSDLEFFKVIARHDEFTLYCAVAIIGMVDDPPKHWLEMARNVTGWGRIHLVGRLVEAAGKNREIKDFLLKEGCKNDVMSEYTAFSIAQAVDLARALEPDSVDVEIFRGSGVILRALFSAAGSDPPLSGIERYEKAPTAVRRYLDQAEKIPLEMDDFLVLSSIANLMKEAVNGSLKFDLNFSNEECKRILIRAERMLADGGLKEVVLKGLRSSDLKVREKAARIGVELGINVKDHLFKAIDEYPHELWAWYFAMAGADRETMEKLCQKAVEKLCPEKGATPKSEKIAVADDSRICLEILLEKLASFPGIGGKLLSVCLKNSSDRVRNIALKALYNWDSSLVNTLILESVRSNLDRTSNLVNIGANNLLGIWSG